MGSEHSSGHSHHYSSRWTSDDAAGLAALLTSALAPGARVLDVGGGDGRLAATLAEAAGCAVTVVDADPQAVRTAQALTGVTAMRGEADDLPFEDGSFDAVLFFDVLHHIEEPQHAIHEAARVVRVGGLVLAGELHPHSARAENAVQHQCMTTGRPHFIEPDTLALLFAAEGVEGECEAGGDGAFVFRGVRVSR